jgi:hypothetical protein
LLLGIYVVFAKLRHRSRHGLVQAFGIHIDAMENAFRIGEGNSAAGSSHAAHFVARFLLLAYAGRAT